jgi:signal transduction histidine kinase
MIRWILDRNWLSLILVSTMIALFSSGSELINDNIIGSVFTAVLAVLLVSSRKFAWLSILLFLPTTYLMLSLSSTPMLQTVFLAVGLFLIAIFGNRVVRVANLILAIVSACLIGWYLGYEKLLPAALLEASSSSEVIRVNSMLITLFATVALFLLAVALGRLAFIRIQHVGTPLDQAVQRVSAESLRIEVDTQNERLEIAKDLTGLLLQKISAVVSVTEGGVYAIKSDPSSAQRVLDKSLESARDAQGELRRLYDFLNSSVFSESATFKIADLRELCIAFRELGYNAVIEEQGESFPLNDGMELCVYKIAFEALQNVRKHAPVGTEISINFLWVEDGLQVLVKDNGIEFATRAAQQLGELVDGYSADDDLEALVAEFDGSTLAVLRERAAIYGGRIEATKVPGVGFTLSAIFPNLKSLANER